jgi:hypothetical protein
LVAVAFLHLGNAHVSTKETTTNLQLENEGLSISVTKTIGGIDTLAFDGQNLRYLGQISVLSPHLILASHNVRPW